MATPSSKPTNGLAVNTARAHRRLRLCAAALIVAGAFLLAHQLGLLPGPLAQLAAFWPVVLILFGLLLVAGRAPLGYPPLPFAIERGDYQSASLQCSIGFADARIAAFAGASQLAVGQFPGGGPRLRMDGSRAQLIMDHRLAFPFLTGPWTISLVKGLPWSLTLRSSAGHLHLNLRDLTVTSLDLRSLAGDVDLTLPATGQGEMNLQLGLGDLTLRVSNGMAIKLKLAPGPLAHIRLDDQRFIQTTPSEWVTPNFSASPQRFTLSVALTAGDLQVI
jgi:hypothetical protein